MFEQLEMAPPDGILGLNEAFKKDSDPRKVNLTVGVFQDQTGVTPILQSVREAEQRLLSTEDSKSYLGIAGLPEFGELTRELLFSAAANSPADRAVTVQTPGGTGALRVAADLIHNKFPAARIWVSDPTWANHPNVFRAAGLDVDRYTYLDRAGNGLDFAGCLASLERVPAGDFVCLHACCHNPTGVDPDESQWAQLAELLQKRQVTPLIDCAYQGFGSGLQPDVVSLHKLLDADIDFLVCSSYSKNFGLYGERVGALTLVAQDASAAQAAFSQLKATVRANYSNPPKHGAAIVATILKDAALRSQWERELAGMRQRIHDVRRQFVETMASKNVGRDFSFIQQQRGMFSFSGLTPMQVDQLLRDYSIYIVGSGRINVAGLRDDNLEYVCDAIAQVIAS